MPNLAEFDNLPELLSPTVDVVFKALFGEERNKNTILADFLSAVLDLPLENLSEITILDPHQNRKHIDDKLEVLDVKLRLKSGEILDIEMQACNARSMSNRIIYYLADMLASQLGNGGIYETLKPVVSIVIADFDFIKKAKKHHSSFGMLERDEHFPFNDLLNIHILELPKLSSGSSDKLTDWLKFFKAKSKEQFMHLANGNAAIKHAVEELEVMSADESMREIYKARLKNWRDEQARIGYGYDMGMEKGMEKGMQSVLELWKQGLSLEEAQKIIGSSK